MRRKRLECDPHSLKSPEKLTGRRLRGREVLSTTFWNNHNYVFKPFGNRYIQGKRLHGALESGGFLLGSSYCYISRKARALCASHRGHFLNNFPLPTAMRKFEKSCVKRYLKPDENHSGGPPGAKRRKDGL